jgi:hypothetical protein
MSGFDVGKSPLRTHNPTTVALLESYIYVANVGNVGFSQEERAPGNFCYKFDEFRDAKHLTMGLE